MKRKNLTEKSVEIIKHIFLVTSTLCEPFDGWVNNFNGPVGLLVGGGKGILRVMWSDPDTVGDYVPVDVVIKIFIIIAWIRGIKTYVTLTK